MRRWSEISAFEARVSLGGELLARKGQAGVLGDVRVEGTTREQSLRISGLGSPGRTAVFRPERVSIEDADGSMLMQRDDARASFDGHLEATLWDQIQLAYFTGYASWEMFTTPFFLAGPGFQTEELEVWHEEGEVWRRLFVWFPSTIATHSLQQTFYFGPEGLQRRVDYCAEVAGGFEVAHYCMGHKSFSGITLPTRRRVLRRDPKGNTLPAPVLVDLSIIDARFS